VDYAVRGHFNNWFTDIEASRLSPKQAIVNAWQEGLQSFIDRSINEWRRRLECVVHQNGGHIEHLFK